jgi:hypothetical protein
VLEKAEALMTRNGGNGNGLQHRLFDLLEYRVVLGAVVTTPDGLLVAAAAVADEDAELIAATTAAREEREGHDPQYWDATSEHGSLRVISGEDMRLIVLTEPNIVEPVMRELMGEHLTGLELSIFA